MNVYIIKSWSRDEMWTWKHPCIFLSWIAQSHFWASKMRLRYSAQKCVGVLPSPHLIPRPWNLQPFVPLCGLCYVCAHARRFMFVQPSHYNLHWYMLYAWSYQSSWFKFRTLMPSSVANTNNVNAQPHWILLHRLLQMCIPSGWPPPEISRFQDVLNHMTNVLLVLIQ